MCSDQSLIVYWPPCRIRTWAAGFKIISGDHYTTTAHCACAIWKTSVHRSHKLSDTLLWKNCLWQSIQPCHHLPQLSVCFQKEHWLLSHDEIDWATSALKSCRFWRQMNTFFMTTFKTDNNIVRFKCWHGRMCSFAFRYILYNIIYKLYMDLIYTNNNE